MAIKLGDMLVQAELITREQLDEALKNQVIFGGKIGTNLIEMGIIDEEAIARFLSKKLGTQYVNHEKLMDIPQDIISLIPREIAEKYKVLPISMEKNRVTMAMSDPADFAAIDEISFITNHSIKPVITPEVRLSFALDKYYNIKRDSRYISVMGKGPSVAPEITLGSHIDTDHPPGDPEEVKPLKTTPDMTAAPSVNLEEELEEAEIIEEEERREILEEFTIDDVSKKLAASNDRDEIAEIIIEYAGHEFSKAILFLLKGKSARGWKGYSNNEIAANIENLEIVLDNPSVLKTVVDTKSFYIGPVPDTEENIKIQKVLGGEKPKAALLMPVLMMGRAVNILYIEGEEANLTERLLELQRIIEKAIMAFDILILKNKIMMT